MLKPNCIFLSFDEQMDVLGCACLRSIKRNYPEHPLIRVLYTGGNPSTIKFLQCDERIEYVAPQHAPSLSLENLPLGEVGHPAVYTKYLLWSDFFADFDKVLYLDADVLVLRALDDLFSSEEFFAVVNHEMDSNVRVFKRIFAGDEGLVSLLKQDGLRMPSGRDDMCNAGVLMCPRRFRTPEMQTSLMELSHKYSPYLMYADQSAISLWCMRHGIEFSRELNFNFQASFFEEYSHKIDELESIHVLHFSSRKKPNTVEFMMWPRLSKHARWQLARLFEFYAREGSYDGK